MTARVYPPQPRLDPEKRALLARINRDEALAAVDLNLPDPLLCLDGERVTTPDVWRQKRRPELLRLFERHVYGRRLPPLPVAARVVEETRGVYGGRATRRQVELSFPGYPGPVLHLVLFLPDNHPEPVPCFLGLNFLGNAAAFADPEIPLSTAWMRDDGAGIIDYRHTEASRATETHRWPVERIVERGYGLATFYYGDVEPDHDDAFPDGVRALFGDPARPRQPDDPGAISAWAWGLSRALDYLETEPRVDARRVALTGHSRLGKTALWAAAGDERFALVIANQSGCGGASLNRRRFGETLHILSNVRRTWFCEACRTGPEDPDAVPVDQHELIALLAPRPVMVTSAVEDSGADPKGEFLAIHHAGPVYRLFGLDGMPQPMPQPDEPVIRDACGYFIRPGPHDITPHDWEAHLAFADHHLR